MNNTQKVCVVGVGAALAPFTAGMSLLFAAVHVGGASIFDAIDEHNQNK